MALNVIKGDMIKGFTPPPAPEHYNNHPEVVILEAMESLLRTVYALPPGVKGLLGAVLLLGVALCVRSANQLKFPANLPRVREKPGATRFSVGTTWAYYADCRRLWEEAYQTYSKHGKTCIVPGIGCRDEVIIPSSGLKWLTTQPDHVLSMGQAFAEVDQVKYMTTTDKHVTDDWAGMLVKNNINVVLEKVVVALNAELKYAFDTRFGTDENDWVELKVFETMQMIVAQGSARFIVGLPLCRNDGYLKAQLKFTDHFIMTAALVGGCPKFLRPVFGSLISIPNKLAVGRVASYFKPLYEERLALINSTPKSADEPQDHIQMMLRYAQANRPHELTLTNMSSRLSMSSFGAVHQTSIAITNVLLNIMDSDAEFNTFAVLREEIRTTIGTDGQWTKAAIAKMVRCDSVCKETLRIHAFGQRSTMRKVMVDGLVTEDGITLPKGAVLSMLLTSQVDGATFEDPLKFDPFRYSRQREASNGTDTPGLSFVSTNKDFLPFGHGRHACPGRFLLEFELKMILAYVLLHYDIELLPEYKGKRPESTWVAEAIMPPSGAKMRVRRKKQA